MPVRSYTYAVPRSSLFEGRPPNSRSEPASEQAIEHVNANSALTDAELFCCMPNRIVEILLFPSADDARCKKESRNDEFSVDQ